MPLMTKEEALLQIASVKKHKEEVQKFTRKVFEDIKDNLINNAIEGQISSDFKNKLFIHNENIVSSIKDYYNVQGILINLSSNSPFYFTVERGREIPEEKIKIVHSLRYDFDPKLFLTLLDAALKDVGFVLHSLKGPLGRDYYTITESILLENLPKQNS